MSEAELYVLRARLNGGIQNKAARGELRRGLPVGFVWAEADGEVRLHPDEAVVAAIRCVFARFAEMGSARRVWLWFRSKGLRFPLQMHARAEIRWVEASYTAIHHVLSNPVYAGAYVYGKTRRETVLDSSGARRRRRQGRPPTHALRPRQPARSPMEAALNEGLRVGGSASVHGAPLMVRLAEGVG